MKISQADLLTAVSNRIITADQAAALWKSFHQNRTEQPHFEFVHVAYYFGALIVISSMGWFMTRAWEQFGGGGLFCLAALYAVCFLWAGHHYWNQKNLRIPGGLLVTISVCMTPLAIYGLQRMTGYWMQGDPGTYQDFYVWVKGSWFLMEVGTICASLVVLQFYRFPFLTAPLAFALWFMSMDLVPLLLGTGFGWDDRRNISMWFGLCMLLAAYLVDRRTKEDFSFWAYLFGLMAFWGGLSLHSSNSELAKLGYCGINLGLMFFSLFLNRRAFMVFGALGVFIYLEHLAYDTFKDSLLFPFALSFVGIAMIYTGVKYQRHQAAIEKAMDELLPAGLKALRPQDRKR